MVFIDNKYTSIYYRIIERAKSRTLVGYKELHHIIPKSFYIKKSKTGWINGDPEDINNKVFLTAKEHFLCHMLLIKMTTDIGKYKMSFALKRFVYSKKHKEHMNSRKYEYIRILNSTQMKGKPCSPETREKIRQGNLNRPPIKEETRKKLIEAANRRKGFTEEGRQRVIDAMKTRVVSEVTKQKLRNINLGKPNTAQKGIKQSQLICPYCNKVGGISAMKHWHFDKCKLNIKMEYPNEIQ